MNFQICTVLVLLQLFTFTVVFSSPTGGVEEWNGNAPLSEADPELWKLANREKMRQTEGLVLIASENFVSRAVLEATGSSFTNKYSNGVPGNRFYGGTEVVDEMEMLCQKRALEAFGLDKNEWGVNVQPYSGAPANIAAIQSVLEPRDRIMGLEVSDGGHFTHGLIVDGKGKSSTSKYYTTMAYRLNSKGELDYDRLAENAQLFHPKLIIAGSTFYPRLFNYSRFREIADENNAVLLADIAHPAGLMAAGVIPTPFAYADLVTTTTHKTLRGTRGGLIFYRKGNRTSAKTGQLIVSNLKPKVDQAVSPGIQGGPHNHAIAAVAVALRDAAQPHFRKYQQAVVKNAKVIAARLMELGYHVVSGGTDTHVVVIDLRPLNLDGVRVETICNKARITVTGTVISGDRKKGASYSGIRIGTPAITSRGFKEEDCKKVADFLKETIEIAKGVGQETGTLEEYKKFLESDEATKGKIAELNKRVKEFAIKFPMPGVDGI